MKTATLVGQRFGRLLVIGLAQEAVTTRESAWLCRCDCGGEKVTRTRNLTRGKCASCGCVRRETNTRLFTKHGATKGEWPPEYRPWLNMKTRCKYEHRPDFKYYGAQGVTLYEPWKTDFEAFRAHIGPRPTRQHSIDRINPYGNYEPGNVRWATTSEQNKNQRKRKPHRRKVRM